MKEQTTTQLIESLEDIKKRGINSYTTKIGFMLICGELSRRGIKIIEREYFDWNRQSKKDLKINHHKN